MQNMPRLYYDFLAIADVACWCVCFWWMHRISSRQDAVLDQLRKQAERIENISKEQHAILAEVHPNVESIQKTVDERLGRCGPLNRRPSLSPYRLSLIQFA